MAGDATDSDAVMPSKSNEEAPLVESRPKRTCDGNAEGVLSSPISMVRIFTDHAHNTRKGNIFQSRKAFSGRNHPKQS